MTKLTSAIADTISRKGPRNDIDWTFAINSGEVDIDPVVQTVVRRATTIRRVVAKKPSMRDAIKGVPF